MLKKTHKFIAGILAAGLVITPCSAAMPVDLDNDGVQGIEDFTLAKNAILATQILSAEQKQLADIDADGTFCVADLLIFKRIAMDAVVSETTISFSESGVIIDGGGATADDSVVTLSNAGPFVISGSCTDGQLIINSAVDVDITLNGLSLASTTGPAILGLAGDATIKLQSETMNVLSDAEVYADTTQTACIESADRLTFKGSGNLIVTSASHYGISSSDELKIKNGSILVDSFADAIRAKDFVEITGGSIVAKSADGDGIKSTKGYVLINETDNEVCIEVDADADGIQAETYLDATSAEIYGSAKRAITALSGSTLTNADVMMTSKNPFDSTLLTSSSYTLYFNFATPDLPSGTLLELYQNGVDMPINAFPAEKKFQYLFISSPSISNGEYRLLFNSALCISDEAPDGILAISTSSTTFNNVAATS